MIRYQISEMATHSSVVAWRILGTEEPGGLPSMGSHRVGHGWSDLAADFWFPFLRKERTTATVFFSISEAVCIMWRKEHWSEHQESCSIPGVEYDHLQTTWASGTFPAVSHSESDSHLCSSERGRPHWPLFLPSPDQMTVNNRIILLFARTAVLFLSAALGFWVPGNNFSGPWLVRSPCSWGGASFLSAGRVEYWKAWPWSPINSETAKERVSLFTGKETEAQRGSES